MPTLNGAALFAGAGKVNGFVGGPVPVTQLLAGAGGVAADGTRVYDIVPMRAAGSLAVSSDVLGRPLVLPVGDQHIRRGADDYAQGLSALLPRGVAWNRDPTSITAAAIRGLAGILAYFDGRAADFLEYEADPRYTIEMLPDWCRNFGIPDACSVGEPMNNDVLRAALVGKMTMQGGQSRAFFIQAAAGIGYTVTITEYAPFMCGVSMVGDTRNAAGDYRWSLGPPELRFFWTVHLGKTRLTWFRCSAGQCGVDPMLRIGLAVDLQCMFQRWKPSHTEVVFDYSTLQGNQHLEGTP